MKNKPSHNAGRLRGSTVMVTGGCGFIGSHLVTALLRRGVKRVVVVDSLEFGSRKNIDETDPRIRLIRFTIGTNPIARLKKHMRTCDILFHLAAQKHNQSLADPHAVYRTNIVGTADLFDLAGASGVKKVIFSSSLYAYGSMRLPAMREGDVPTPHTVYGISKLCGEHLLGYYGTKYKFPHIAFRFFFVYGPRQYPGLGYKSVIVSNFERLLRGEPPVVFGDGKQTLDYVYVDDVVQALLLGAGSSCSNEVLNVGSGRGTSINVLTKKMIAASRQKLSPVAGKPDWTAGTARVSNVQKIRRILHWTPRTTLAEGLAATAHWLKETL